VRLSRRDGLDFTSPRKRIASGERERTVRAGNIEGINDVASWPYAGAPVAARTSPASTRQRNSGESGGGASSGVQPVSFSSA
jgi:hypothetical protein